MITINNKQYRNLEETVRYLTEQYNANQGIAEWGIRILGVLASADELPDPATYTGEYGDAYAVGAEPPYNFYIWTRSAVVDTAGFWFDFGDIAIAGPQGIPGESIVGPAGKRGSLWYVKTGQPTTTSGYNVGDCYLNPATGNVWHLHDVEGTPTWLLEGNIRGPQGVQGIQGKQGNPFTYEDFTPEQLDSLKVKGDPGPAGPVVDILGTATLDQLAGIDPATQPRQAGYLVEIAGENHVYIIIGEEGNLRWFDAGIFGTGSLVTVGGSPVATFNADTKVSVLSGTNILYGKDQYGNTAAYDPNPGIVGDTIAKRLPNGTLRAAAPEDDRDLVNRQYFNSALNSQLSKLNTIFSRNLPANGIYANYVSKTEYGMYLVCGPESTVSFTIGSKTYNTTNNFHMFFISDPTNANASITYLSAGGPSILDASIKMYSGELATNITISTPANSTALFTKMGMKVTMEKT